MNKQRIAVVGLGYVGLPLAVALSKKFQVIGYDKKINRIIKLKSGIDNNGEVVKKDLKNKNLIFASNEKLLENQDIFIICVPTPIYKKKPNLRYLIEATKLVARKLKPNNIVIYESTVYPGTTEEICSPLLEKISSLKLNKSFFRI